MLRTYTLRIKLQEVMRAYSRKYGIKMNYEIVAERTGIHFERVKSIGARPGYNANLDDLARICVDLKVLPGELLVVGKKPRKSKKTAKKRLIRKSKKSTKKRK